MHITSFSFQAETIGKAWFCLQNRTKIAFETVLPSEHKCTLIIAQGCANTQARTRKPMREPVYTRHTQASKHAHTHASARANTHTSHMPYMQERYETYQGRRKYSGTFLNGCWWCVPHSFPATVNVAFNLFDPYQRPCMNDFFVNIYFWRLHFLGKLNLLKINSCVINWFF